MVHSVKAVMYIQDLYPGSSYPGLRL